MSAHAEHHDAPDPHAHAAPPAHHDTPAAGHGNKGGKGFFGKTGSGLGRLGKWTVHRTALLALLPGILIADTVKPFLPEVMQDPIENTRTAMVSLVNPKSASTHPPKH